jgi:hypothetical protein
MKTKQLSFIILLLSALSLNAQKMSIENVYKVVLKNSGAIKEATEVKGYFFFYVSDKIDRKTNEYTLQITDSKLKKLKDIKFVDSKNVSILESSFNGKDLIFLFFDSKERTFEYQVYGTDGAKKHTYTRALTKKEKAYLEATYLSIDDDDNTFNGLYPIEGKGFISNTPSREDKDYTFQLDFFSSNERKQWSYIPTIGAKKFVGDYLGTYNGVVYLEILKFSGMFDQKPESNIVGLDLETGKQLFEKVTDGKYRMYPASLNVLNNGNAYVFGEYFDPNDNIMKDKSRGFAFWQIDTKGQILSEKYASWDEDFSKFFNVSSKGKIEDFGFMYLHNMMQTADGSIYAVGEGYKKVVSGLGIASTILNGGRSGGLSTAKMKVTDLALIKFDANFKLKEAKIYEKNSNKIEMQSGMEFVSTPMIGKLLKFYYGGFDYKYAQINKAGTAFNICYEDFVRGKDYKGSTFNSISYIDGKITTDKVNTKSDASRSSILQGPQGQVLIMEYYRKDKRLDIHFEKLN